MKTLCTSILLLFIHSALSAQVQCCKDHLTQVPCRENTMSGTAGENNAFSYLNTLPAENLSKEENAALLQMREEELLAYDVYNYLFDAWGIRIFNNIADSESRHASAIKALLEKYNIADPAENHEPGKYNNKQLQALYHRLTAEGAASYEAALKTGALLEETDIKDLQQYLENTVDNRDISMVFGNLKRASEYHLRAFTRQLSNRGLAYSPVLLEQEAYEGILNP